MIGHSAVWFASSGQTLDLSAGIDMASLATCLAGPFVGSFLASAARAFPDWGPVLRARSTCAGCGRALPPLELVPIVSFLALGGRCRACKAPIAPALIWGEALCFLVGLLAGVFVGGWTGLLLALAGWAFAYAGLVDLRIQEIPHVAWIAAALAGLAQAASLAPEQGFAPLLMALATGIAAFGVFSLIAWVYKRLRGREGLGAGDANLALAIGIWTGPDGLAPAIALGAGLTLAAAFFRPGRFHMTDPTPIPFGPGLALGGWALSFVQRISIFSNW